MIQCLTPIYSPIDNVLFVEGLKHNLLSIIQLCESGYDVSFNKYDCIVQNNDGSLLFSTKRKVILYKIRLGELSDKNVSCLFSVKDDHQVWHKKLGHASLRLISKLQKHNLVRGLPSMSYKDDLLCETCQKGKQVKKIIFKQKHCFHLKELQNFYILICLVHLKQPL